jgi:hypothetical protein
VKAKEEEKPTMMAKRVYSDFERNQILTGVTRMYNTECGTLTRLIEESGTIYGINYSLGAPLLCYSERPFLSFLSLTS